LGVGGFSIPWGTLFLSVVLFVVIPLLAASLTRYFLVKNKGLTFYNEKFVPKFSKITTSGLLLTLILIFPLNPCVALVTIVGVLVEVPVMLILVKIANATKSKFIIK